MRSVCVLLCATAWGVSTAGAGEHGPCEACGVSIAELFEPASHLPLYTTFNQSLSGCTVIINSQLPITQRINVQVIRTGNTAGLVANGFGTPEQQTAILHQVDCILAQAGVDVEFTFSPGIWVNDFAYGDPTSPDTRPGISTMNRIMNDASAAGVTMPSPTVNMFLVRVPPGWAPRDDNWITAWARQPGNAIAVYVGGNLPPFTNTVAQVVAHEIGHNTSLPHTDIYGTNLMQAVPGSGQLAAPQIQFIDISPLTISLDATPPQLAAVLSRKPHAP